MKKRKGDITIDMKPLCIELMYVLTKHISGRDTAKNFLDLNGWEIRPINYQKCKSSVSKKK